MKSLLVGLLTLQSFSAFANYKLSTVDKIEVLEDKNIRLTYTLPCKNLDFETFVGASDDSGDREVRVGVVYACREGKNKAFQTTVTPSWAEYEVLKTGLTDGASLVPMKELI